MPAVSLKSGLKLWVEDDGGDKEPLLLLNGAIFNLGQWNRLVKSGGWREHFRLIRFDYADTGNSERREGPTSIEVIVEETLQLLDALSLDQVHLYGVSQGTIVAQGLAARAPERLKSVCGYGWYHGDYSRRDETIALIEERLVKFRTLSHLFEQPLDRPAFDALWAAVYRVALMGDGWEQLTLMSKAKDWGLRRLLFPLLAPTPIGVMHDWFAYCIAELPTAQSWLREGHAKLADVPVLIQHARADQTLAHGMATELHAELPGSTLITYEDGYNHVSPNLIPAQAKQVVADHLRFLGL